MDTQANKSATQDTAGMDPKGKECNAGMQAMCAGESLPPAPPHPLDYAIAELRSKLSVLEQNHAVAINMEDYVGAALFNEKRKSVSRAEALLRSIRCWS